MDTGKETPSHSKLHVDPTMTELVEKLVMNGGQSYDEIERQLILGTLAALEYNRTRTARRLKIGVRTLQRKLRAYGASELGLKDHHKR